MTLQDATPLICPGRMPADVLRMHRWARLLRRSYPIRHQSDRWLKLCQLHRLGYRCAKALAKDRQQENER